MTSWNRELQAALTTGKELAENELIEPQQIDTIDKLRHVFALKVPPSYMDAIKKKDASDPIWRTVVPTVDEQNIQAEEMIDPIGDEAHTSVRGITHRYPDRVLFKPTLTCAVYCRFCFRRYAVGHPEETLDREEIRQAFDYIAAHPEIWEVIFTGGDPLTLSDGRLEDLLRQLREIDHVKIIRFHTRIPVVLPGRITEDLAKILRGNGHVRKSVYIVTHINHTQEITPAAEDACSLLVDHGIPLLNQCVLLRGINDKAEIMEELLRRLVEIRIKPYYLHHGDLARGTSHLRTTIEEGQALMKDLRGRVSGICQPTYVLDIPGGYGKVPINASYLTMEESGWVVEDIRGARHPYPPNAHQSCDRQIAKGEIS